MPGYYGKLPSKGDFIGKGLPRDATDTMHAFFADGMSQVSESMGPDWINYYSVAPLWYFYIQPGIIDEQPYLGIWMPSVDRVNRHFPFVAMQPIDNALNTILQLSSYQESLFELESLLLDLLEAQDNTEETLENIDQFVVYSNSNAPQTIEAFLNSMHEQSKVLPQATTDLELFLIDKVGQLEQRLTTLERHIEMSSKLDATTEIPPLLSPNNDITSTNLAPKYQSIENVSLVNNFSHHSVWVSAGNDNMSPQLLLHKGLPNADMFSQFLVGL